MRSPYLEERWFFIGSLDTAVIKVYKCLGLFGRIEKKVKR